jgi:opacity protein-like surface antigen
MKKLLLSGLALGAFIAPAVGADMPPYYKAAPAPVCAWCGWYIGVNAGYHWFNSGAVDTSTTLPSKAPAR